MNINKEIFFSGFRDFYKAKRGTKTFPQKAANAVDFLLESFSNTPQWKDIRHVAYAFATIAHETAWTFEPINEYGKGRGRAYGRPDSVTGKTYFGRGYVQLTWKENYANAGKKLGIDLVNKPELALDAEVAFKVLTRGMFDGWFAGDKQGVRHKLERYINDSKKDYKGARKIINGTDKQDLIAGYARDIERMLAKAVSSEGNKVKLTGDSQPTSPIDEKEWTEGERPVENEVNEPTDDYPVDPKPGEPVPDAPAGEGEAIVGGRPGDPPKEIEEVKPQETSGLGTWVANIRAQWASLGIGGLSLGSLGFLTNPLFIKIALGLLAVALIVSLTVYLTSLWLKSKEKRDREQRAHELTMAQMRFAADPTKYNVQVVK